jgi:hypothetical protein
LTDIDDDTEVYIENVVNPCGNISELGKVQLDTYASFGMKLPCVILKSVLSIQDELED